MRMTQAATSTILIVIIVLGAVILGIRSVLIYHYGLRETRWLTPRNEITLFLIALMALAFFLIIFHCSSLGICAL